MKFSLVKWVSLCICLFFSSAYGYSFHLNVKDSVGIEKKGGYTFILHKVEPKETMYGLSKRYNVTIAEIIDHNPEIELGLKIGEILKIPYHLDTFKISSKKYHVVEPSQTLYSISKEYDIEIDDIKNWNNLRGNDLNVGQELVIYTKDAIGKENKGKSKKKNELKTNESPDSQQKPRNEPTGKLVHKVEPGQTLFSISKIYEISIEDIKKWNELENNELSVGQLLTIRIKSKPYRYGKDRAEKIASRKEDPKEVEKIEAKVEELNAGKEKEGALKEKRETKEVKNDNPSGFKKIVELGMAEVIEESSDTKKYVALHRTAPVGTIIQVTNEMNNQNVFVRVIGKLPSTGVNDKVLIKLSRPAFERLGAVNNRFPAEISYVP